MTILIDPYSALVALAKSDSTLTDVVSTRIDIWHRYGQDVGDWATSDSSLIMIPRGGAASPDTQWGSPVFEVRCYASSPFKCGQVWIAWMNFTIPHNEVRTITIDAGKALVNSILPQAGQAMPRLQFDEEIKPNGGLPYYALIFEARISLLAVT